jgi:tRNA-splicing ligase RtcB
VTHVEHGYELIETPGKPIKAWVKGVALEDAARDQLARLAQMPFIHGWIAAMPDVHAGIGATVGSVVATKGAVIPAAVGVDIGCGMLAAPLSLRAEDLPSDLHPLREAIERAVPHGRTNDGRPGDRGAWGDPPPRTREAWAALLPRYEAIVADRPKIGKGAQIEHLGTLGTGNHFIELCLDMTGGTWIMLHSGSRGVGNRIGMRFIEAAKEDMRRWFVNLPDQDLAYFPEGSEHFDEYVRAVSWAQDYARENRRLMLEAILDALRASLKLPPFAVGEGVVNCHHNYVSREKHLGESCIVTRKGAVRARAGELGIIPGSMGSRSYIVRGKGNVESFESCSHGAGRAMSRTEARRRFTLEDHAKATAHVECRKDADVIDETPAAYKPIDKVMAAQADLVEIVHELSQVLCVKG